MALTPTKKYIDINGLGFYHEESAPEMTYAEWQALPDSKLSDGREYHITDLTVSGVEISDSVATTTNVWSASKVNTELNTKADVSDMPIWTAATPALTGATSCTVTNSSISSTSVLEVFFENTSMTDPVAKVTSVSGTTATISFDALAEDTNFRLRITNL